MRPATAAQLREIEGVAIRERGIPSLLLMERAAAAVRAAAARRLGGVQGRRVAVLCAAGKNGGDGFAAARLLREDGAEVCVYALGDPARYDPDTKCMRERWDGPLREAPDGDIAAADCVIDALYGIGFRGALSGAAREAVSLANARRSPGLPLRIAVDVPSGVESDTGRAAEIVFHADITVTFTLPKPGLYLLPGALYAGRVEVADLGIPGDIYKDLEPPFIAADEGEVDAIVPRRRADAHKGDFGRVLLVGGSADYPGAICMAAQAAVRGGAGLVTAAVPQCVWPVAAAKLLEAMPRRMPQDAAGRLSPAALPALLTLQSASQAVLIGPGLSRAEGMGALVTAFLQGGNCPAVVDADGINALAPHIDILQVLRRTVVLTPHDGEFARLCGGAPPPAGGPERLAAAAAFAGRHRCVLVLKGHRSVVAAPDGRLCVNTTGNPGMAQGGSGDILAGLTCALLGQGLEPAAAAAAAVYLHGAAGDDCANALGEYGMAPSDLLAALPARLRRYNSRTW